MNPEGPKRNPSSLEDAKRRLKWKRLMGKKWFFPIVYLAIIGLMLAVAWWYQGYKDKQVSQQKQEVDTMLPAEETMDSNMMHYPVSPSSMAEQTRGFYQEESSKKTKESTLVKYANTYWPHSGIDFARKDKESFSVVSVLDGKVSRVENNPILGKQIFITHDNGLTTLYQSLHDVVVKKGQTIKKGDTLGTAGRNQFEKESGIHLHFEVLKGQKPVNPEKYLLKN